MLVLGRGLVAIALIALVGCAGMRGASPPWLEVRSDNFSIFTALGEREARQLIENLELFRAALLVMTRLRDPSPRVPTEIYAFRGSRDYDQFRPRANVAGFFVPGLRSNWVAFEANRQGIEARALLYHEYTHFLLRNEGRARDPMWFQEGYAELLGAIDVRGSMVRIGVVPPYRRGSLSSSRLPYSRVLRARSLEGWSDNDTGMFYTQSWLLVHYLTLGAMETSDSFTTRLDRYVAKIEQGSDEETAFREAFGIEVNDLAANLRKYTRKLPAFGLTRDQLAANPAISVRALPSDETDMRLGWLAMHTGRVPLAQTYFERALTANPNNARARAGIGDVHKVNQRWDDAEASYQRALELAPDDWQNQLEYAEYFTDRAISEEHRRDEKLAHAREHFHRAIALAPENPEAHAMLGLTYTVGEQAPEPGIASLERAAELLPSHPWIEYPLAELHYRAGDRQRAIELLRRIVNRPHGEPNPEATKRLEEWEATPAAEGPSG
jgi:tetratricopeptide (TPR) repeat protein